MIEALLWSGANSVHARDEAGKALATQLREQRVLCPGANQIVVAHSHGGNVALRAIEHLGGETDRLRIATMATPFFEIFPSPLYASPFPLSRWLFGVLSLLAGSILLAIAGRQFGFSDIAGPAAVALAFLCALFAFAPRLWPEHYKRKAVLRQSLAKKTSHGAFENSDVDLFVLRGVDDEASFALGVGAFSSWISRALVDRAMRTTVGGIAIILLAAAFVAMFPDVPEFQSAVLSYVGYGTTAIVLLFMSVWVLLIVSTLADAVFGWELLGIFLDAEISSNSVPDTIRGATVHTLVLGGRTFWESRHKLYDHRDCPRRIASWVLGSRAGSPLPLKMWDLRRDEIPEEAWRLIEIEIKKLGGTH